MRIGHRYLKFESNTKIIKPAIAILTRHNISYKYQKDLNSAIPSGKHTLEFYLYEGNPAFSFVKAEIDESIFKPGIDIALTHEHFGSGASANRITIVSKRLKEIVEKNKLKGLYFTPILPENLRRTAQ